MICTVDVNPSFGLCGQTLVISDLKLTSTVSVKTEARAIDFYSLTLEKVISDEPGGNILGAPMSVHNLSGRGLEGRDSTQFRHEPSGEYNSSKSQEPPCHLSWKDADPQRMFIRGSGR